MGQWAHLETQKPVNQHPPKEVSSSQILFLSTGRSSKNCTLVKINNQISTNLSTSDREIGKYAVLLIFVSCVRLQALQGKSHRTLMQLRGSFISQGQTLWEEKTKHICLCFPPCQLFWSMQRAALP